MSDNGDRHRITLWFGGEEDLLTLEEWKEIEARAQGNREDPRESAITVATDALRDFAEESKKGRIQIEADRLVEQLRELAPERLATVELRGDPV